MERNDSSDEMGSIFRSICIPHITPPSFALFSLPLPTCTAMQYTYPPWSRSLFLGDDMIQLSWTSVNSKWSRTCQGHPETPRHYWGRSQQDATVTLSGFTWEPCCRGSFRQENQSCSQLPCWVSCCKDKRLMTVAALESFSEQVRATWTKRWQALGTQGTLFLDLVSNLPHPVV